MGVFDGGAGWDRRLDSSNFPDPFADYASLAMPESMPLILRVCELAFMANGTYREANRRIYSYFITRVIPKADSASVKEQWDEFFNETIDINSVLHTTGLDLACYGNSFVSLIPTFIRYMSCPRCRKIDKPLRTVMEDPSFKFSFDNFEFCASCPICKHSGPWTYNDRHTGDKQGFRIKRWNPHHIELLHDEWTGETRYIWKIPTDYAQQLKQGKPHVIEHAPRKVIEAVKNNNYLLFEKDFIHHMREDALAGIVNRGWGISRVLINFRQLWYVQVLHRYNEALAMDYIIPFRLITPVPGDKSTGADVLHNMNAGGYMAQVHRMLRGRARNPIGWNTLPFPVEYQAIGGDASKLAPSELLTQGTETLLNCVGTPAELYRGTLTVQAMPTALRLFEASNASIPHNYNGLLRFIVRKASGMLKLEPAQVALDKVTHADDANRQLMKLQLVQSGDMSKSHGMQAVGVDWRDEVRQTMDDQQFQAEEQAKLEERMQNSAQMQAMRQAQAPQPGQPGQPQQGGGQGGQPAQPGQPGAPGASIIDSLPQGPNQETTPQEQLSLAQSTAQQLAGMPESQRLSELRKLKQLAPTLHPIVRAQLDAIRQQARLQGGAQVMASMFPKQGADDTVVPDEAKQLRKEAAESLRRIRRIRTQKP